MVKVRPLRHVTWNDAGAQAQRQQWQRVLEEHQGNITRAAQAMGFTKGNAMRITKKTSLNAYAAELRKKATGRTRGRPWDKR